MAFQGTVYYLAGDRYPADRDVEEAICSRLRSFLPRVRVQEEWLNPSADSTDLATRLDHVAARLRRAKNVVLIGRSSGARAATLLASSRKVHAVIGIAYPFRVPHKVIEPERFAHLSTMTVPTMLLQGTEDEYGGANVTEQYAFSPAVRVHLLPGVDHGCQLSPAGWDAVATLVLSFINATSHCPAPGVQWFDESDYLRRYPDVAAAVTEGHMPSGYVHYMQHGRREGRRFRLHPLPGCFR